jgi:hypothetical protein
MFYQWFDTTDESSYQNVAEAIICLANFNEDSPCCISEWLSA